MRKSRKVQTKCYPATIDCADVAVRFLGVPQKKVSVSPLGVDTQLFSPVADEPTRSEREQVRKRFGFAASDVVCIYTGRFSKDKNPLCLAQAVARLVASGQPFKGLFVGNGPQEEVQAIAGTPGCVVHPLVPFTELPPLYRSADVGCWPKQESTSMLDAAACGIPLVVSDRVAAVERYEGNGLTYRENDADDLARALLALRPPETRKELGDFGAAKIQRDYSWLSIARKRLDDYETARGVRRS